MRIKEYVKENKWYLLVMCIGVLLFAFQLHFVVLYADDFCQKLSGEGNWVKEIFQRCYSYYFGWRRHIAFLGAIFGNV